MRSTWLKFIVVGLVAVASEFTTFLLLHSYSHVPLVQANVLSFCVGLAVSFTLNKNWSFSADNHFLRTRYQFGAYVVIALLNMSIGSLALRQLVAWGVIAGLAKLVVMGLIATWNYVLYQKVIFRKGTSASVKIPLWLHDRV